MACWRRSVSAASRTSKRLAVLRAIDKFDRLGRMACARCWAKGRKDESGDFTKGAELTASQIDAMCMRFHGCRMPRGWATTR